MSFYRYSGNASVAFDRDSGLELDPAAIDRLSIFDFQSTISAATAVPRFRETIPIDDYVIDVLLRDLVGHDGQPAAFLVFIFLYGRAARKRWRPIAASLRTIADATGLSKSAVQTALHTLQRRELVATERLHRTAVPEHRVMRHWRETTRHPSPARGARRAPKVRRR